MPHLCHYCNTLIAVTTNNKVGFRESCDKCHNDLHVCLNCVHYDKGSYNQCRETNAERIIDKDKANHCDYFQFGEGSGNKEAGQDATRKKLDDLFK